MNLNDIKLQVLDLYNITEPQLDYLYNIESLGLETNTPTGYKPISGFIRKQDKLCTVTFDSGKVVNCGCSHMFVTESNDTVKASNLVFGNVVLGKDSTEVVAEVAVSDEIVDLYDISVDSNEHVYYDAAGVLHHNTHNLESEMRAAGLSDGDGYFKTVGAGSAAATYETLFNHRKEIILFDECDTLMNDPEVRNMIKAATDSGKTRKISFNKKGGNYYDPAFQEEPEEGGEQLPRYFNFEGGIILVANVSIKKLDPDGAIRTRGFVMEINPTKDEMLEVMRSLVNKIELPENLQLSNKLRQEVFEFIQESGGKQNRINMRTLVNALKVCAAYEGQEGWQTMVKNYVA